MAFCVSPLAAISGCVSLISSVAYYSDPMRGFGTLGELLMRLLVDLPLFGIMASLLVLGFRRQDWVVEQIVPSSGVSDTNPFLVFWKLMRALVMQVPRDSYATYHHRKMIYRSC